MNIVKLSTTNFKRAHSAVIEPDQNGNLVIISGNNGHGKSSILDSIAAALGGTNSKTTPKPIRDGADRAEIILETQELTITRVFTPSGSRLTVTDKSGAKFAQAQTKLNDLVGKLSMDPLAFTLLDDRKQRQQLLDLVELPFNPSELDEQREHVFKERTEVNRRAKEFEAALSQYEEFPDDLPSTEVSVSELLGEYRAVQNELQEQRSDRDKLALAEQKVKEIKQALAKLQAELVAWETDVKNAKSAIGIHRTLDLDSIQSKIDNAEETNRLVRRKQEKGALQFKYDATKEQADELTKKLDEIDKTKADGLAAAKFPVEGLGFDEDGVTYKDQPFKQASTAEKIRVGMAMAMALNPELRVIRIADGALLDQDSLEIVEETARKNDFQVWVEMIDEYEGGFTIVDGELQ